MSGLVDTVAALVRLGEMPERGIFDRGAASVDFESGGRTERLWREPRGEGYEPRLMFWPASLGLRVEFSVQKLGGDLGLALGMVDEWLSELVAGLGPVAEWQCQRVDYCLDFEVGEQVGAYLAAIGGLQAPRFTRIGFEGQGVVFKSGARWVKFYDKQRERRAVGASEREGVLRFEVSNFRDAVRYMSEKWFRCERTVRAVTEAGRALFVLAYYLDRLGLSAGGFGEREALAAGLREQYGSRSLAGALHAHECIRVYGAEAWRSLGLMSRSGYYRWLAALRADGFLVEGEGQQLRSLVVPIAEVLEKGPLGGNLKKGFLGQHRGVEKNSGGKNGEKGALWGFLSEKLGFDPRLEPVSGLLAACREWVGDGGRVDAEAT